MIPNNPGIITNDILLAAPTEYENDNGNNNQPNDDNKSVRHDEKDICQKASSAVAISLSFLHIRQISNIESFKRLTTLKLDNNYITKIENLSSLVNLTWLDLSFNQITTVEGLEHLTNLADLSLYHNRIKTIPPKSLDACISTLQCLSLGHNLITTLTANDVSASLCHTLRRFHKLRVLTLRGNPATSQNPQQYENTVLAHLPSLKYLDYRAIDVAKRADAETTVAEGGEGGTGNDKNPHRGHEKILTDPPRVDSSATTTTNTLRCDDSWCDTMPQKVTTALFLLLNELIDDAPPALVAATESKFEKRRIDVTKRWTSLRETNREEKTHFDEFLKREREEDTVATVLDMNAFRHRVTEFERRQRRGSGVDDGGSEVVSSETEEVALVAAPTREELTVLEERLLEREVGVTKRFKTAIANFVEGGVVKTSKAASELWEEYFDDASLITERFIDDVTPGDGDNKKGEEGGDGSAGDETTTEWRRRARDEIEKVRSDAKEREERNCRDLAEAYYDDEHERNRDRIKEIILFENEFAVRIDAFDEKGS
mmetsp:Transcript_14227/g.17915  ORF Transcript_14227/g.17915 Transcript_14227/m.17915 type:complete len:544 (-) Transcript_14227:205-1836(-)